MKAKTLSISNNAGINKYVVWYYDGIRTNNDGSFAASLKYFRNKPTLNEFISGLTKQGYTYY
jgi:hypothetical protein